MAKRNSKVTITIKGIEFDKKSLSDKYREIKSKFRQLGTNLKEALIKFLNEAGIKFVDITYRIKNFDSFWRKIQRKKFYNEPFEKINDICGLRIIHYYPLDYKKITEIINQELFVIETIDKQEELKFNQFGYRSTHFIVKIKQDWTNAPNYRGLDNIICEIQVRTILMHAWAEIEHELAYKSEIQIPGKLKRKMSQLSALFEIADDKLEEIRTERTEFIDILSRNARQSGRFDAYQQLNLDTLQAFLDFYFPNRHKNLQGTSELLENLQSLYISLEDLVEGYEKTTDIISDLERRLSIYEESQEVMTQIGMVWMILYLTNESIFNSDPRNLWKVFEELYDEILISRKKIKDQS